MRATAAFSSLLRLEGAHVRDVVFEVDRVVVQVALRRRRLICPRCSFSTPHRHDVRPVDSDWRHLDLGVWRLEIRARLRRLVCLSQAGFGGDLIPSSFGKRRVSVDVSTEQVPA